MGQLTAGSKNLPRLAFAHARGSTGQHGGRWLDLAGFVGPPLGCEPSRCRAGLGVGCYCCLGCQI